MFALFCLFLFFTDTVFSYQCKPNGKCTDVSAHQKFVYCDALTNECVCRIEQGFVGNATPSSPCDCPPELDVFQDNGLAYCTKLTNGVAYQLEKKMNDHIIATEMGIYNGLIHPQPQITLYNLINGLPDPYLNYFTPDTKGRVSPVGTFYGLALVVEYYGGATYTGATRIVTVGFNSVTAYNYTGTINVDLTFNVMNSNQTAVARIYNLTQSGFDRYTKEGKIWSADKIIHNLDAAVKWVGTLNFSSVALHTQICGVLISLSQCNSTRDPAGYYANMSECIGFMATLAPGSLGDTLFDANTVACRYFHMVFTRVDPVTHCPHAGKIGGGKCIVSSYITYYQQQYKKRVQMEMNTVNMNMALNDILLGDRLNLIVAGIPSDSPLVTLPLDNFHSSLAMPLDNHHGSHKKDPIAQTKQFIDTMRGNNFALFDSIMLPQIKSLINAGIPADHPMIRGPQERMVKRKRTTDFFILDPDAMLSESLSRDSFTLPPVVA